MALVVFGYMTYDGHRRKELAIEQQKEAVINQKIEEEKQKAEAIEAEKQAKKEIAQMSDSTNVLFAARQKNEGKTVIENELLRLTIDNKGGQICKAELKDKTYKNQEGGQVVLFDENDSHFGILLDGKNENIITEDLYFTPSDKQGDKVNMQLAVGNGSINIEYALVPNSYLVNMTISADNLAGFFPSKTKTLDIEWTEKLKQQEKPQN